MFRVVSRLPFVNRVLNATLELVVVDSTSPTFTFNSTIISVLEAESIGLV